MLEIAPLASGPPFFTAECNQKFLLLFKNVVAQDRPSVPFAGGGAYRKLQLGGGEARAQTGRKLSQALIQSHNERKIFRGGTRGYTIR